MREQLEANSFLISWKSKMHKGKQNSKLKFCPVSQRLKHGRTAEKKRAHRKDIMMKLLLTQITIWGREGRAEITAS